MNDHNNEMKYDSDDDDDLEMTNVVDEWWRWGSLRGEKLNNVEHLIQLFSCEERLSAAFFTACAPRKTHTQEHTWQTIINSR